MNNSIKIPTLIYLSRLFKNRILNSNSKKVIFLTALLSLGVLINAFAVGRTSAGNGDWNTPETWSPNGVPTSLDDITIAPGHAITINGTSVCKSLVLADGGTAASVTFLGSHTLTVDGAITLYSCQANNNNKTINVGSGTLIGNSLSINGGNGDRRSQVLVTNGIVDINGNISFTVPSGGGGSVSTAELVYTGAGTLKIAGTIGTGGVLTLTNSSTVYFDGTMPQILPTSMVFNNVVINNPAGVKPNGNITSANITGNFTVMGGTYNNDGFSMSGSATKTFTVMDGATFKLSGTTSFPGSFGTVDLKATSKVIYDGSSQSIAYLPLGYGHLQLSNTGSTKILPTNCMVAGNFIVDNGVTLNLGSFQISGSGAAMINGTLLVEHPNGLAGTAGAIVCSGGITLGPISTVEYRAAGDQVITPRADYANIVIANSGTKTLTGNLTLSGNLTVNSASTLDIVTYQIQEISGGNASLTVNGTFITGRAEGFSGGTNTAIHSNISNVALGSASIIHYNGSGTSTQIISARNDYKNIILSENSTKVLENNIQLLGNLTEKNTSYFLLNQYQIQEAVGGNASVTIEGIVDVKNTYGLSGGNFTAIHTNVTLQPLVSLSKVMYTATTNQTVTPLQYSKLTIENNSIKTAGGNLLVDIYLEIYPGATLDMGTNRIVKGNGVNPFSSSPYFILNGTIRTANATGLSGGTTSTIDNQIVNISINPVSTVEYTAPNQIISPRSDYGKVLLSGGGSRTMGGVAVVATNLDLSGGKIVLGSHQLIIEASGSITNYSNINYIEQNGTGKLVIKNIGAGGGGRAGEVIFPVGTVAGYTPAYINNIGPNNNFSVSVSDGVYDGGSLVNTDIVRKTWNVTPETSNGVANITLRLEWNAFDEAPGFNRNNCTIGHYSYARSKWTNTGPYGAAGGANPFSISRSGLTDFSPFTVGGPNSPLPVELVYFKATKRGETALLEWETATEKDNKGFEIQASADGKIFTKIGFVESQNSNSNTSLRYQFTDVQKRTGVWYYRLKQIDLDGTVAYSEIERLEFNTTANVVNAYPNPFSDQFVISMQSATDSEAVITLHDVTGKTVYTSSEKLLKGSNELNIKLSDQYPAGLYILTATAKDLNYTTRIIKK